MYLSDFKQTFSKIQETPQYTTQPSNKSNIHKRDISQYLKNWKKKLYSQKRTVKLMLIIISQFHSYPISAMLLKKLFMIDSICILKMTISFVNINLDLEQIIQQIAP